MRQIRPLKLVTLAVWVMLLAACASSTGQARSPATARSTGTRTPPSRTQTPPAQAQTPPADSPLTTCIDPTPPKPNPVDTALAQNFANERVRETFSLDDGSFRAAPPPHNARPKVSAALAFCNLLAGATAENWAVVDAAAQHGMSFGLGVVTIADSVLRTGPQSVLINGVQRIASPQPYHARLAWIAVIKPDVVSSCPKEPQWSPSSSGPTTPTKRLPGYQILAFDADMGADGIIYSAKTNNSCGRPGYSAAWVAPAVEFISAPWALVSRGPGPKSATISYQRRPCDQFPPVRFGRTGQPVVMPEQAHPALVGVDLTRILTTCGPAVPVNVLLRSATLATDLPAQLVHAPVGARDTTQQDLG